MQRKSMRIGRGLALAAMGLLLGGCDAAWFTADLGTDAPADAEISSVQVNLLGLEFRRADGTNATLEFRAGELVDLLDLRDSAALRLFTNEELPAGQYTGVRLLFDEDTDANVVLTGGREFPLLVVEGAFADVAFSVEDEERSREEFTLMLDLRQSLRLDEQDAEYTLTPLLRAVPTADAARIEGSVAVACPAGTVLTAGGAIYLYSGRAVLPDDLDGAAAEPFATTGVTDSGGAGLRYALRFLPAGNYTLAFTCRGDEDVLGADDDLEFRNVDDIQVDDGDVVQRNLD